MFRLMLSPPAGQRQTSRWSLAILVAIAPLAIAAGCQRGGSEQYGFSPKLKELEPELQQAVKQELIALCGTANHPKLLGGGVSERELLYGQAIYRQNCQQCHGVSGDGDGPAAQYLMPRPRDFRRGIFKFTSTPYGYRPRRADLVRTVQRGIVGTAMPSFRLLPKQDLEAVVDYVLALSHRGELEQLLIQDADDQGEMTKEQAESLVNVVLDRWKQARNNVVEPATPMPEITPETIAEGRAIFLKRECFKCHGRDGRGGLAGGIEVGPDAWGRPDPAADLTSGMLHGGQAPLDIYRRISSGINGTPMPAFKDALAEDPNAIWELTHYVMSLADQRRRGVQFAPGAAAPTGKADETKGDDAQSPSSEPAS